MLTLTVLCTSLHTSHSIDVLVQTHDDVTSRDFFSTNEKFPSNNGFPLCVVFACVCVCESVLHAYMCVDVGKIILVTAYSFQQKQVCRERSYGPFLRC